MSDCCAQPPGSVRRAALGTTRHALHLGQNVYIILSWAESITATTSNYLIQIHSILQSTHILLVHILQCESLSHTCSLFTIVPCGRVCARFWCHSHCLSASFHSIFLPVLVARPIPRAHTVTWTRERARACVYERVFEFGFHAHAINTIHHILQNNRE